MDRGWPPSQPEGMRVPLLVFPSANGIPAVQLFQALQRIGEQCPQEEAANQVGRGQRHRRQPPDDRIPRRGSDH